MATRKELIEAVGARYRSAPMSDRKKILDEFVALTGYHRKHASRLLSGASEDGCQRRPRNRLYDEAVHQALVVLWEAGDHICGKRLKPLILVLIDAMERHGYLELDPSIKEAVLRVSAATIDRALREPRACIDGLRKRRIAVGAAIRRSIPVRTFADWRNPPPGFFEADDTDRKRLHGVERPPPGAAWRILRVHAGFSCFRRHLPAFVGAIPISSIWH